MESACLVQGEDLTQAIYKSLDGAGVSFKAVMPDVGLEAERETSIIIN